MDGFALLREVSGAYRKLKFLALEAAIVNESGDENTNQRSEHRVRFFYSAADRMRYERCGKNGIVQVEPPAHPGIVLSESGVRIWVHAGNRMVVRQQGEVGRRLPAEDEVIWNRHDVLVREMRVDGPLPEETFPFAPPAGAASDEHPRRGITFGGGGGGFIQHGPDGKRGLEHSSFHEWDGDTAVEHSKWKIRGTALTFERRLTFSEDEKDLHAVERISGPKGEVETSCSLRVG